MQDMFFPLAVETRMEDEHVRRRAEKTLVKSYSLHNTGKVQIWQRSKSINGNGKGLRSLGRRQTRWFRQSSKSQLSKAAKPIKKPTVGKTKRTNDIPKNIKKAVNKEGLLSSARLGPKL